MRLKGTFIRWLFMVAALGIFVGGGVAVTAAQCVVRTDWPVYTVQRGDTVGRIAQRYGTNISTLVIANCISNANYIFAGQQLRVPPNGGTIGTPVPPGPVYPSDLAATFQAFEHGFMTWKAGTGEIGVYYAPSGSVANGGIVRIFAANSYGNLPDNPFPVAAPAGFYKPVYGFGRVWGNYADVRQVLGWATGPENGYLMRVYPPNSATYQFGLPDGRTIYVNNNVSWSFSSSFPTIVPSTPIPSGPVVTTTNAAYQPFQNGFTVWEAATQNVVVFYNNGSYQVFLVRNYGTLPDNPVLDPTPAGLVRPAFGFGKVWGNYPAVRQALGWATQGETGWTPTFRSSSPAGYPQTCFVLPDGRPVSYALSNGVRFWNFVGSCA